MSLCVEIELKVDGRSVLVDIEPNNLAALKKEFNELCEEDDALKRRRETWAPTFSMYGDDNVLREVKRKYSFSNGNKVVVQWTSLEIEVTEEGSNQKETNSNKVVTNNKPESSSQVTSRNEKDSGKETKETNPKKDTNNPESNSENTNRVEKESEKEDDSKPEDSDDTLYGLVKEYFKDEVWKKLPVYVKMREKNRFELHEEQLKLGLVKGPFQPDICSKSGNDVSMSEKSSSASSSPSKTKKKSKRNGRKRKLISDSDSGSSGTTLCSTDSDSKQNTSLSTISNASSSPKASSKNQSGKASNSRARQSKQSSKSGTRRDKENESPTSDTRRHKDKQPTPSTSSAGRDTTEIKRMKPQLPRYNIPSILKKLKKNGKDDVQDAIKKLNEKGILVGKERQLVIRILVRHLYYKIAENPKKATPDMREGLAKSIVLDYPKFQDSCDGKTTYPWKSLFDRQGRGWIANASRAIQKKHTSKKTIKKRKKDSSQTENDEFSDTEVQKLALLMPGRAEKSEILDGMKNTFSLRQAARGRQDSVKEILEKFPHLANYDGEVLQEEFKRLRPDAQDMSLNFQKKMPNIIALGSPDGATLPLDNDVFKALLIISKKLPRDIRNRSDPKRKSTAADFQDIVQILQLGQDIDEFVAEKVSNADGPIQPYLILVKSPVRNSIVRCFLILDQKPVQLSTTSILKSFEFLLKSYFIFNVNYPLGWRGVFHCLATCFANVFEDQTKRKSRPDSSTPSEKDFMNSIKDSSE